MDNKWLNIDEGTHFTVVPDNDIKPHGKLITATEAELSNDCECKPQILMGENGEIFSKPIVIHNAFDNREYEEHGFNLAPLPNRQPL